MPPDDRGIADDETLPESPPSSSPPAAPAQLGAYQLGARIGAGGMGEVRSARDTRIGRDVAVKRLLSAAPSRDAVARFVREARIQARLDHPSIVPVHDVGEDDAGRPYFAMKQLAGVTLARRLAEPAADTRALLNAFVDACAAIELAHTRGVVHRDLKPANVMLGAYREVYVLDWGVARVEGEGDEQGVAAAGGDGATTRVGDVIGTPNYMAPEQARGELVGPPADVFALGAILFEILAGEPLRGDGAGDAGVTSPARRRPDRAIPPEVDAACSAALAAEARDRPTAHALGERVQRYLDGDRDHEARRSFAAEQLARARAALGAGDRAGAMHAAGRALALDPDSDAAGLISRMLVEPPREVPGEVEAAYARIDAGLLRAQVRDASAALALIFLFVPFFGFLHVTSWPLVGVTFAVVVAMTALGAYSARQPRPLRRGVLALQLVFLALLTRIFGPFLLVPALAPLFATALCSAPPRLDHPVRTLALVCAGPAIVIALEVGGVLSSTWRLGAGTIELGSAAFDMDSHVIEALLIAALFVSTIGGGLFARRLAMERRDALRRLELQAWQLRKLVER
jgi:serine/threonine protein kinase